jgi:site-specific DNA recombinase
MRAAIYARYSSENQREASIEDQLRLCHERVAAEGWIAVQVFQDRAVSGSSALRSGYQALLAGARDGSFDVVVAEALDRLSRDQEDVAALYKRLRFAGIKIITLSEGEISELHVGLKGTMNALFLKDLAAKTHRGLRGRIETGHSAGGLCFGYEVVRQSDARGEPIRGGRRIDASQAETVRRIFGLFAGGTSPIGIAKLLNAEGSPGPAGRAWRDTTIRGHAARGTGLLRNELYVGRLVWNRMRFLKDPATGKRVSRPNPREEWIVEDVPELRIIDADLWGRVQSRLAGIRENAGANAPDRDRWWDRRRPQHLLSTKCVCGLCGGSFTNIGRDYLACSAARKQSICSNNQSIRREVLDTLILDALRTRMMQPELVAEFVAAFTQEWNGLQAERSATSTARRRELDTVQRRLSGLIDAIADGIRAPGLQQKLDELESRKATLAGDLAATPGAAPRLMPNLAELYSTKVASLHEALRLDDGAEALELVRSLIESVVVSPAPSGDGLEIELIGEIAAMVELAQGGSGSGRAEHALFARSIKLVAGTGFEPVTFRL